jgi:integrase/recombinase XerD
VSETNTVSPLRQRMIEDMAARKLNPHTQRSHIQSCKRFAAWLKRSPDTATPDGVRRFQLYLIQSGASICNRNRIISGSADRAQCTRDGLNTAPLVLS